jgi:hypothetical protein
MPRAGTVTARSWCGPTGVCTRSGLRSRTCRSAGTRSSPQGMSCFSLLACVFFSAIKSALSSNLRLRVPRRLQVFAVLVWCALVAVLVWCALVAVLVWCALVAVLVLCALVAVLVLVLWICMRYCSLLCNF